MNRNFVLLALATLTACGGGGGGGGYSPPPGGGGSGGSGTATIYIGLPTGLGTESDATWGTTVGGYTQQQYSQVLGFNPGTTVTIKNLAASTPHTLSVINTVSGPPYNAWPGSPSLSTTAAGGSSLAMGYSSGTISGNGSVTVTLSTPGDYLIGCAYHYGSNAMRDILVVANGAQPGPQASNGSGGGGTGGGGYGGGY